MSILNRLIPSAKLYVMPEINCIFRREEFVRGPIHDMREMIDTRGRLTSAGPVNLQLPSLSLKTIMDEQIAFESLKNTLLCISSSALGLESLSAVIEAAIDKSQFHIHLLHGYLRYKCFYYPLRRHLVSNLKSNHKNVILKGPVDELKDNLGVLNNYGGYAFWISKQGSITWRSSGGLTPQELQEFTKIIRN